MILCRPKDTYQYFDEKWNDCSIRYGDLKKQLAEDIAKFNAPIRERINEYSQDIEFLDRVAKIGAEKARESASKTLEEVRKRSDSEFNRRYSTKKIPLFFFSIPETELK